ncbi:MAG: phage head-tail connector protein [Culicoidibacterales bacterium]
MINTIVERVKLPLSILDSDGSKDELLLYFAQIALDRISLRLGAIEVPEQFASIACEFVVASYRKLGSEGVSSKQVDVISTSFVSDFMNSYNSEFERYLSKNVAIVNKGAFL